MPAEKLLLDTCALLWLMNGETLSEQSVEALVRAEDQGAGRFVSAITAWEIGILVSKGRMKAIKEPGRWFSESLEWGGFGLCPVTVPIMIASSFLPQPIHNDPMDRMIIATAREQDLTILTRDRAILTYGALGHVRVLEC